MEGSEGRLEEIGRWNCCSRVMGECRCWSYAVVGMMDLVVCGLS